MRFSGSENVDCMVFWVVRLHGITIHVTIYTVKLEYNDSQEVNTDSHSLCLTEECPMSVHSVVCGTATALQPCACMHVHTHTQIYIS
jgi:hypothetical protein